MSLRPTIAAIAAATVIAAVAGFFLGRNTAPTKTVEKTKTVEVVKEVAAKTKEASNVQTDNLVQRDAIKWRTVYVHRPDGTVERTTEGERASSVDKASNRAERATETEVRYVDREVKVETVKVIEASRPSWGIAVRAGAVSGPRAIYGLEASRRLVGPVWLGAYGTTAKEIGLTVRVEF
jgi:hypothetical protein